MKVYGCWPLYASQAPQAKSRNLNVQAPHLQTPDGFQTDIFQGLGFPNYTVNGLHGVESNIFLDSEQVQPSLIPYKVEVIAAKPKLMTAHAQCMLGSCGWLTPKLGFATGTEHLLKQCGLGTCSPAFPFHLWPVARENTAGDLFCQEICCRRQSAKAHGLKGIRQKSSAFRGDIVDPASV